nr:hypothetical protein [uncultured Caproiciproducens sp.]
MLPFLMKIVESLKSQVESKSDQALPVGAMQGIIGMTEDTEPAGATQTGANTAAEVKTDTAVAGDAKTE